MVRERDGTLSDPKIVMKEGSTWADEPSLKSAPADLKGTAKSREGPGPEALVASAKKPMAAAARPAPEPQSGTLTAGSFDDNLFPGPLRSFASRLGQTDAVRGLPGRLFGRRLVVTARGQDGQPLGNARVRVRGNQGAAVELISRSDGRVVFLSSWEGVEGDLTVRVTPPDGSAAITRTVDADAGQCSVALPQAAAALPKNLDLVLVLDTTGSMGDELAYLKAEFRNIARTIAANFPHVNQRYSLIVYRDRGDEYVVRRFEFTPSVAEFCTRLGAQQAVGGGDYPEAMHRGLEEAVTLPWRTADTARVLFLVADAPPHAHEIAPAMTAVDALRKKGVAIYPLACSGYDDTTELVMRTSALLTGSQFLFLTDDSGVGEAHGEPHIPFYHVQRQNRLMVRMISGELLGRRLEPARDEIVRTVGNAPRMNGQ
jgi:hypothetical protein